MMQTVMDTNVIIAFADEEKDKDLKAIEKILEEVPRGKIQPFISSLTLA